MAGPLRSVRSPSMRAGDEAFAIQTATAEAHRAIEAIWRIEAARLIAGVTGPGGDIGTAEALAQDALVAALEQWPTSGVPERPGAWLMGTAKHHATDLTRRRKTLERKYEELGRDVERDQEGLDLDTTIDEDVGDDLLGLIFMACHPVLSKDARVALTLRVFGGLTTEEIARGFLVPVSSIAQRIVRAKRTLAEAHVRFEVPGGAERVARLASVLEVIYLIFSEGSSATAGEYWVRRALCEDALRLGRILAELTPTEPEVHGLVALMEIHASRLHARVGPSGEPVLLLDQDRTRWDRLLIRRGLAALERAERLGGAMGPYALQAAIAACHARATTAAETDWPRIVALFDAVAELPPSDRERTRLNSTHTYATRSHQVYPTRSGPDAVGPPAHPSRPRGARARRKARGRDGPVCASGGDRRVPRTSDHRSRDRLAPHRGALRRRRGARPFAGGRTESSGRRGYGVRSRRRTRSRGRARPRAIAQGVSPAAGRPR